MYGPPFQKKSHDAVPVGLNAPDTRISFYHRLLKAGIWPDFKFQVPMDRSLESHRGSLRRMMMKHEETFKQQVHELHRLYKVQKMLMAELRTKEVKFHLHSLGNVTPGEITDTTNRIWSSGSTSDTSHSSYISIRYPTTDQLSSESSFLQLCNTRPGPSSRELSICSDEPLGAPKGVDLEWMAVKDGATAAMLRRHLKGKTSVEGPDLGGDGECDIELTLSIGCGADKKKSKNCVYSDLGCSLMDPSKPRQLISPTAVRQERITEHSDRPTSFNGEGWLLQSLSLNRR